MSEDAGARWQVEFVRRQEHYERIRAWARQAARLGQLAKFLAALRFIVERLGTGPLDWGDPQYRSREGDLIHCHAIRSPFLVRYAVRERDRTVWIKELLPLPGQGLDEGSESQP
jgi:hypothetical protein